MATTTQSLLLAVGGNRPTDPTLYLQPTVQRASPAANAGWKYRRRCTITNTGTEPISNYPYAIDLGVTTSLVSGSKAQSDADDVRVWQNGREVSRSLVDWNSATATLVWIVIPYLGAGASLVWDVVYGNSAAVAGGIPALTLMDDLPAFDISTAGANRSTNAKWVYQVDRTAGNAGKGGWGLDSGTAQPNVSFGIPGAWQPANTRQSDDDRWQEAYSTYTATGTKYQGRFEARRALPGALTVGRNSGVDGVSIRNPLGLSSVRADLKWTNLEMGEAGSNPVGQVVILTRNSPDEEWGVLYSNNAVQATEATIATATYTPAAAVKEVAFAVWPYAGDNVDPAARPDRYVNAAWNSVLELNINSSVITQSLAAEEEIYELATELRYGGGGDSTPVAPYKAIRLGNAAQASGEGTPRFAVALNQQVKIDAAARKVDVWNSGLTAKVEDAPIPGYKAVDGILDSTGATTEGVSAEWIPLIPTTNPLTNPSADTAATGWSRGTVTAGITVNALSRDTGTFDSTPASFTATISANTSGTNGIVEEIASDYLPVGSRQSVSVGVAVRTENANIQPTPSIWFYDASQSFLSKAMQADWTVTASAFRRRLFAAAVPSAAVYYRVGVTARCKTSNPTGQYRFDTVEVNDTEIALLDVSSGTLSLRADWTEQHGFA